MTCRPVLKLSLRLEALLCPLVTQEAPQDILASGPGLQVIPWPGSPLLAPLDLTATRPGLRSPGLLVTMPTLGPECRPQALMESAMGSTAQAANPLTHSTWGLTTSCSP